MTLIFGYWILIIIVDILVSAFWVRKTGTYILPLANYVLLVLMAQIFAVKLIVYPLLGLTATMGTMLYPETLVLLDTINEFFGKKTAYMSVVAGTVAQLFMIAYFLISIGLNSVNGVNAAWNTIFSVSARIASASIIAFVVDELFDAYVYAYFKQKMPNKLYFRYLVADIPTLTIDTLVFTPLAFYGVVPVLPLMTALFIIKYILGVGSAPLMYAVRAIGRTKQNIPAPS
ncbi:MAG: queuosine precursor transporter [Thermoprotei archaeon]